MEPIGCKFYQAGGDYNAHNSTFKDDNDNKIRFHFETMSYRADLEEQIQFKNKTNNIEIELNYYKKIFWVKKC